MWSKHDINVSCSCWWVIGWVWLSVDVKGEGNPPGDCNDNLSKVIVFSRVCLVKNEQEDKRPSRLFYWSCVAFRMRSFTRRVLYIRRAACDTLGLIRGVSKLVLSCSTRIGRIHCIWSRRSFHQVGQKMKHWPLFQISKMTPCHSWYGSFCPSFKYSPFSHRSEPKWTSETTQSTWMQSTDSRPAQSLRRGLRYITTLYNVRSFVTTRQKCKMLPVGKVLHGGDPQDRPNLT